MNSFLRHLATLRLPNHTVETRVAIRVGVVAKEDERGDRDFGVVSAAPYLRAARLAVVLMRGD